MNLIDLIEDGLKRHGYDGLYNAGVCACKLDDLAPCGEVSSSCEPGVFTNEPCVNCCGDKPCDFHIGPIANVYAATCPCCGATITPNDRTDACPQCGRMRCVHCDEMGRSCRVCFAN